MICLKEVLKLFRKLKSKCYEIIGQNLQNFMNIWGKILIQINQIENWFFMMDTSAEAVLDGNKFF